VQIVTSAAGMESAPAPPEAREVVRLCKRLPLTLGMAGRMVKDLGLEHDWAEVAAMMQDELSVDGEARSAEDSVIATSLGAIHGPNAEAARTLFKSFGLIPEDVKVPLEALQWIYQAEVGEGAEAPSLLQLRKCTKLLIDRCLVLGPIDQPSLHDMVLEFAQSLSTADESRAAHRRLVNIFRQHRPELAAGTFGCRWAWWKRWG